MAITVDVTFFFTFSASERWGSSIGVIMKHNYSVIAIALLVFCLHGCSAVNKSHDLSTVTPFTTYVGHDLLLTREIILVKNGPHYFIGFTDEPTVREAAIDPSLTLPVGTSVHVGSTTLETQRQSIFQGFFYVAELRSLVDIRPHQPGWPEQVRAVFDHSVTQSSTFGFGVFTGKIRPSPWEPIDTPSERYFAIPSQPVMPAIVSGNVTKSDGR